MPRANSGSFLAPKRSRTMIRITKRSGPARLKRLAIFIGDGVLIQLHRVGTRCNGSFQGEIAVVMQYPTEPRFVSGEFVPKHGIQGASQPFTLVASAPKYPQPAGQQQNCDGNGYE